MDGLARGVTITSAAGVIVAAVPQSRGDAITAGLRSPRQRRVSAAALCVNPVTAPLRGPFLAALLFETTPFFAGPGGKSSLREAFLGQRCYPLCTSYPYYRPRACKGRTVDFTCRRRFLRSPMPRGADDLMGVPTARAIGRVVYLGDLLVMDCPHPLRPRGIAYQRSGEQ